MKKLILLVALASALAMPSVAAAQPPLRECGSRSYAGSWTYGPVQGAGIFNVVARVVSCRTARDVAMRSLDVLDRAEDVWTWKSWRCRFLVDRYELSKIRCTAARGRLVQFVTGA